MSDQPADLPARFAAWRMADPQPGRRSPRAVYAPGRPPNETLLWSADRIVATERAKVPSEI